MAKRVTNNPAAKRYAMMKRRISKMQRRAKGLGLLYLLGTVALAALTVLALVMGQFWNPILALFTAEDLMVALGENAPAVFGAVVNALLVLAMVVNVVKSLTKLGWLFKKKASRAHGFNRNMYAMDDMGKIFARTFSGIIVARFVVGMLAGGMVLEPTSYLMVGAGLVIYVFCGLLAGNVSVFSTENGLVEEKREIGNFVPFVRTLVQVAVAGVLLVLTMGFAPAFSAAVTMLVVDMNAFLADPMMIANVILVVAVVLNCFMVRRALNNVEFDPEGPEARGKGMFLFLSVVGLLVAVAAYFLGKQPTLTIAAVALVSVVFEACTVKCPKEPKENLDEIDAGMYLIQNYVDPSVYIMPNMIQHPIQQQNIVPYQGYGFELEYGMKKPAKMNKR